ncbi:inositol monophosphatase family protein [Microbacterium sp. EST19A]|uniref:inositol monophosphatase family protein n=1 Tax=Microbacterium sp. EST19A TaxID=2862681 RepID=UPI001CBD068D|nr:inositol monophosphatase family protein [Microbacterium sp. EST19A]
MIDDVPGGEDREILARMVEAVESAGSVLLRRYSPAARISDGESLLAAIDANDEASTTVLRPALEHARPSARWDDDEEGTGPLGAGEWWVTDAAEGNVNHIHGSSGWAVTATLVRDDVPVLTAVHIPLAGETYTAAQGGGAFLDGAPLSVSQKTDLAAALVSTGQAKPGEDPQVRRRLSASIDALLDHALLVAAAVPATLQILPVASGHTDAFWQYGQIRSGLVAGALLVREAGGVVLDARGADWTLASDAFVATTPALATAMTAALSLIP